MGKSQRARFSAVRSGTQKSTRGSKAVKASGKRVGMAKSASEGGLEEVNKAHIQKRHLEPTIPFERTERILLVGEGDLSFAKSLVRAWGCVDVTATVLEGSEEVLRGKYMGVEANLAGLLGKLSDEDGKDWDREDRDGHDGDGEDVKNKDGEAEVNKEEADSGEEEEDGRESQTKLESRKRSKRSVRVLYGVDATKMTWSGKGKSEKWKRIIFNFPHVGGKSTDVNRQVRYNQELLVNFFRKAEPLLSPGGTIIVTLFEGEPYTLWNVKDLARHSGLAVERSFRFQSKAYPGYRHARTFGAVKGGGGWRGEERSSRSFVFARRGEVVQSVGKRERSIGDEDESD